MTHKIPQPVASSLTVARPTKRQEDLYASLIGIKRLVDSTGPYVLLLMCNLPNLLDLIAFYGPMTFFPKKKVYYFNFKI